AQPLPPLSVPIPSSVSVSGRAASGASAGASNVTRNTPPTRLQAADAERVEPARRRRAGSTKNLLRLVEARHGANQQSTDVPRGTFGFTHHSGRFAGTPARRGKSPSG